MQHYVDRTSNRYHLITLDVDNGPGWIVRPANNTLYQLTFTKKIYDILYPNGVYTVWSCQPEIELKTIISDIFNEVSETKIDDAYIYLAQKHIMGKIQKQG